MILVLAATMETVMIPNMKGRQRAVLGGVVDGGVIQGGEGKKKRRQHGFWQRMRKVGQNCLVHCFTDSC